MQKTAWPRRGGQRSAANAAGSVAPDADRRRNDNTGKARAAGSVAARAGRRAAIVAARVGRADDSRSRVRHGDRRLRDALAERAESGRKPACASPHTAVSSHDCPAPAIPSRIARLL